MVNFDIIFKNLYQYNANSTREPRAPSNILVLAMSDGVKVQVSARRG